MNSNQRMLRHCCLDHVGAHSCRGGAVLLEFENDEPRNKEGSRAEWPCAHSKYHGHELRRHSPLVQSLSNISEVRQEFRKSCAAGPSAPRPRLSRSCANSRRSASATSARRWPGATKWSRARTRKRARAETAWSASRGCSCPG